MDPDSKRRGYFNYPEPIKGPDVPYFNGRKSNPALRGPILVVCAYIMEWLGFVRYFVWLNAGFGSLRKIFADIQDYEPFYEPTIVPLPDPGAPEWTKDSRLDLTLPASLPVPAADKYPSTRYYTAEDYHNLYLSGKLTPTDVARSLLPLIRKKESSAGEEPGPHQVAFFQSREELVLKAAEASTLRYRKKKSLGPLDGVPTAVKNEYDMDGYKSCLGSVNDYTSDQFEDGSIDCWSVRKLKEAGCVIIGSLHMVEFGLDTPGNNTNYGTPPNPYNPKYYTGGSSSGCGYAVASGLIPFALGSDGGGSIRIPASFCSVYGLKPTHGRLSFKPVVHSSATSQRTLGIPRAWFERADSVVRELCLSYIDRLVREHGYETVDIEIPYLIEGQTAHALTVLTDAAGLLPEYGNLTTANRILLALGRTTPSTDHLLAQKLRRLLVNHLSHLWHKYPGMVIMTPTTSCAGWPVRNTNENHWGISDGDTTIRTMEYVWLANFCGLPSISFPAGYAVPEGQPNAGTIAGPDVVGKVPVGIMATSEWATETDLLRLGLDAEVISAERNVRAPNWVDVIGTAQKSKSNASE
ncbi:Amidase family protein [Sporothrix brasiliensis 5110]|uniref:Amidase family protein n=1 Tax=Sporothrix brasiliensis 5110 TaxID=1398154 RepID=A0A0C2FGR4_9PEZI|nr:Amidase family protein [Sporothrix brasiliensis 5110]KIH90258.1 Amidase family protein [Sporothrix brasiliensis 5110]